MDEGKAASVKLFYIQSIVDGVSKVKSFLEDNYVGIPWSALGDLEQVSLEEITELLKHRYGLVDDKLSEILEAASLFADGINDGDYVVIKDEDWMYVGDIGDYYYDDSVGTSDDLICHRRGVTWLGQVPLEEINEHMQSLLNEPKFVAPFQLPVTKARLDQVLRWKNDATGSGQAEPSEHAARTALFDIKSMQVDQATIEEALAVLKEALHSKDEQVRVTAATSILQYAKL